MPDSTATTPRLGISAASYGARRFASALAMLTHAHTLGAGSIQTRVRGWDTDTSRKLRDQAEAWDMAIEGQISLPKGEKDIQRFGTELRWAKEAGVEVLRTVALSGRRYETFRAAETFKSFKEHAWQSLRLAEPLLRQQKLILAVENHKDWIVPELLDIMESFSSPYIGVCLDTGNSISLLEDAMEVVEAYAPYTVTTHFKDMDVRPNQTGFLLSEVPLGQGVLDLKKIVAACAKHRPNVRHHLEMITRDPLDVPCLEPHYWATFPQRPGRALGQTLGWVAQRSDSAPLPTVSQLSRDERIKVEETNVRLSFAHAQQQLGL